MTKYAKIVGKLFSGETMLTRKLPLEILSFIYCPGEIITTNNEQSILIMPLPQNLIDLIRSQDWFVDYFEFNE